MNTKVPRYDPPLEGCKLRTVQVKDAGTTRVGGGVNARINFSKERASILPAVDAKRGLINCELREPEERDSHSDIDDFHQTGRDFG